jgi:serine/threonine protein kinase
LGIYALTGVQPHELPSYPRNGEVIWRNWANISESMADVLTKMVRYNFSDRYQSAFDALDAVKALAAPPIYRKSQVQPNLLPRRKVIQGLQWMVAAFAGYGLAWVFTKGKQLRLQTFNFETVTVDAKGNIINRSNLDAKYFAEDLGK